MTTITHLLPALGLRVVAGTVELRGLGDDDLAALADLAARGIHPADRMPFYHPWTDAAAWTCCDASSCSTTGAAAPTSPPTPGTSTSGSGTRASSSGPRDSRRATTS